ncbi:KTSC domain-containing protein [Kitasatospora sp. NPDC015120]|uniref:KTSC domain-containing protein n=1 Tax=Kitasatospora sp. NPDC015120 TaxID=3364023 RepID=UPI0036F48318
MNRTPVDSSALRSVGYDAARRVLELELTAGGRYACLAVPGRRVHRELMAAESRGRYFVREIRDRYDWRRLR